MVDSWARTSFVGARGVVRRRLAADAVFRRQKRFPTIRRRLVRGLGMFSEERGECIPANREVAVPGQFEMHTTLTHPVTQPDGINLKRSHDFRERNEAGALEALRARS